jgi:hypothetical protein
MPALQQLRPVVDKPDFEALRAKRNAAVAEVISAAAKRLGIKEGEPVHSSFNPHACYCACATKGPCEHDFKGWRDLTDDEGNVNGGETFCERCSMGSMSHSLRCEDW